MLSKSDSCDEGVVRTYEITRPIIHKRTARQMIEIDEYKNFGVGIWIDGWPQCAESDTDRYHQALVHPALIGRTDPFSVVILGGGDFGAAHELTKHPLLSKVHIVDWDLEFIEIAKEHLKPIHREAWQDSRVTFETSYPDIFEYFGKTNDKFDYVFGDLTDLNAMGDTFPNFMRQIRGLMIPGGTFVSQFSEFPTTKPCMDSFCETLGKVAAAFEFIWIYRTYIPSFGYEQAYLIASDSKDYDPLLLTSERIATGLKKLKGTCLEYSPQMHHSFFAVSPRVFNALDETLGDLAHRIKRP